jgi:hypothetical protein
MSPGHMLGSGRPWPELFVCCIVYKCVVAGAADEEAAESGQAQSGSDSTDDDDSDSPLLPARTTSSGRSTSGRAGDEVDAADDNSSTAIVSDSPNDADRGNVAASTNDDGLDSDGDERGDRSVHGEGVDARPAFSRQEEEHSRSTARRTRMRQVVQSDRRHREHFEVPRSVWGAGNCGLARDDSSVPHPLAHCLSGTTTIHRGGGLAVTQQTLESADETRHPRTRRRREDEDEQALRRSKRRRTVRSPVD